MKIKIIVLTIFLIICYSTSGYSRQDFLEHRYKYELGDVLNASKFVKKTGYWEGYKNDKLVGYVLLSKDWTKKRVGYSGKHMETLIGFDIKGVITGLKLLFHSEPIVLIGLKEKNYQTFLKQYPDKNIKDSFSIGKEISIDSITGATVTAVVHNAIILESAKKVASQIGLIKFAKGEKPNKISQKFRSLTWDDLLDSGAIKNIKVTSRELDIEGEKNYIDLYFGVLTPPSVGRNILGKKFYDDIMSQLKKGESVLFIASKGKGSFKGSGFVRGGIFDRFSISQKERVFVFRDMDYKILTDSNIMIKASPSFREGGLFIVRNKNFDPSNSFEFNLILTYRDGIEKKLKSFNTKYKMPDSLLENPKGSAGIFGDSLWVQVWERNLVHIILFSAFLLVILLVMIFKDKLAKNKKTLDLVKYGILIISFVYVGLILKAQPTTTNMVILFNAFKKEAFPIGSFLMEPFIFLSFIFITLTLILWGRGVFCGYLCPYGAMLELLNKLYQKLPEKFRFELPEKIHGKLIYLKYIIFIIIVGVSFYSFILSEYFTEVEPFRTFVLKLNREWYFVLYFMLITVGSMIVYRAFCRYLCPLGGALAIPSFIKWLPFIKLKRYKFCSSCKICTKTCEPLAIGSDGTIDSRECLYCLSCQVKYYDKHTCPVLIKETKNLTKEKKDEHLSQTAYK